TMNIPHNGSDEGNRGVGGDMYMYSADRAAAATQRRKTMSGGSGRRRRRNHHHNDVLHAQNTANVLAGIGLAAVRIGALQKPLVAVPPLPVDVTVSTCNNTSAPMGGVPIVSRGRMVTGG